MQGTLQRPVTDARWCTCFLWWLRLGWRLLKRRPISQDSNDAGTQDEEVRPEWFDNDHGAVVSLLGVLFQYYTTQNRLLWSRVTLLLALQGGGLAACYKLGRNLGPAAAIGVAVLTFLLLRVLHRDRECRNANLELMCTLEDVLLPDKGWIVDPATQAQEAKWRAICGGPPFPKKILVGVPSSWRWAEAGRLLIWVMYALILVDFIMAALAYVGLIPRTLG